MSILHILQSLAIHASDHVTATLILIFAISYSASLLPSYFKPALHSLPGPKLAAFTRLWKLYISVKGDAQLTYQAIHKKYGPIVRTGPKHVSIGDPAMISEIFNVGSDFTKVVCPLSVKLPSLTLMICVVRVLCPFRFDIRGQTHGKSLLGQRSHIPQVPEALRSTQLPPFIPCAARATLRRMLRPLHSRDEQACWDGYRSGIMGSMVIRKPLLALQYSESTADCSPRRYAFDVMGQITFLQKFGFMEQGKDVNKIIEGTWTWMQYASTIGQVPELHKYLLGNATLGGFLDKISDANPMPLIVKVYLFTTTW